MGNKFIDFNDTVEGAKCDVTTRKQTFRRCGAVKDPIANEIVSTYSLDKNATVEVIESLSLTEEELKYRKEKNIHNDVGDTIIADAIKLYVQGIGNCLKFTAKEGVSGRHGAQLTRTKHRTIGTIQVPLAIYRKQLGYSPNSNLIEQK